MPIRLARDEDLPEITRIYNESIAERVATADTEPRTLEDRREWLRQFDERHPLWVGESGGRVVSYGGLFRYSPKDGYRFAAEDFVYVGADARGRGHGRAMLEHVVRESERLGFRYLLARIFAHNPASLRTHERAGFRILGTQRGIVMMDGRWYDVVLMDRLSPAPKLQ